MIEPKRIVAIDATRPLCFQGLVVSDNFYPKKKGSYLVIISPKIHKPSKDAATPRTADETMWVTGEVTLMERRDERHIKKPRVPFLQTKYPRTGGKKNACVTYGDQRTPNECGQRRAGTLLSSK